MAESDPASTTWRDGKAHGLEVVSKYCAQADSVRARETMNEDGNQSVRLTRAGSSGLVDGVLITADDQRSHSLRVGNPVTHPQPSGSVSYTGSGGFWVSSAPL